MTAEPASHLGAPRSRIEGSREDEILDAALGVLERVGCDRLTMDAVAAAAHAGKASLYRRWGSKSDLVADAIARAHRRCGVLSEPDTGSLRGDLVAAVCDTSFVDHRLTRIMGSVLTAMQHDDELRRTLLERFVMPRKAATLLMFERARDRGEVHAEADLDMLADILPAMLSMRVVITGDGPDSAAMVRVIDQVLLPAAAASAEPPSRHRPSHRARNPAPSDPLTPVGRSA